MTATLAYVTLVVRDYDEAIRYFVDKLGFQLVEDAPRGPGKRWVMVRPSDPRSAGLLLARAATPDQERSVGNQTGGRVSFFLHTSDFASSYRSMQAAGVRFLEEPRAEAYGRVVVFADLYGNRWDLIEPSQ